MKNSLIPLFDYKKINEHQLNQSKSKYLYSFPKNKRFVITKKQNNQKFYNTLDPNFYKSKRSTSWGYGTKYDFTKNAKNVPAPNAYNIKRNLSNVSYSFGVSRENMGNKKLNNNPGPGQYQLQDIKSNIKWSFRLKLDSDKLKNKKQNNYNFYEVKSTFNSTGVNFISKYKNSKAPKINPINQKTFKINSKTNRGFWPYYNIGGEINKIGNYNNSKFSNSKCSKFSQSQRQFFSSKNNTPGPGKYILPSEFGVYVSSNKKDSINN